MQRAPGLQTEGSPGTVGMRVTPTSLYQFGPCLQWRHACIPFECFHPGTRRLL